jgi:hypothetical protein
MFHPRTIDTSIIGGPLVGGGLEGDSQIRVKVNGMAGHRISQSELSEETTSRPGNGDRSVGGLSRRQDNSDRIHVAKEKMAVRQNSGLQSIKASIWQYLESQA